MRKFQEMKKIIPNSIFVIITLQFFTNAQKLPSNPCPNIFQYAQDGNNKYGLITIPGRKDGKANLVVSIARYEDLNDNDKGELTFQKSREESKQDAMRGLDLKYSLKFPQSNYWPILTKIRLNDITLCAGPEVNLYKVHYPHTFTYPKGPKPVKNNPISPCPNVFQYQTKNGIHSGIITIPGPRQGKTVLSVKIAIYEAVDYNNRGNIGFLKPYDQVLEDAKNGRDIQYILNFPQFKYWPAIAKITLNHEELCNAPEVTDLVTWTYSQELTYPKLYDNVQQSFIPKPNPLPVQRPVSQPNLPPVRHSNTSIPSPNAITSRPNIPTNKEIIKPDNPDWLKTFKFQSSCGTREGFNFLSRTMPVQLIIGGIPVEIKEYPWMVALFEYQGRRTVFFCGANLVTDRHVITAAHCIKRKQRILLEFGTHDLYQNANQDFVVRSSNEIVEHPEYEDEKAHADIAVVSFDPVTFTNTIRPICIWHYGTNFDLIRRKGTIAGWGQVEQGGSISDIPMQVQIERTDINNCRNSNQQLAILATDKTFCAGGNLTGPCQGDSGSGFYINHTNKWYLRGVISTSIGSRVACYLDQYAVYVDIVYFLDWIRNTIS